MFSRPPHTYTVDPSVVDRILAEPSNPLHCIAEIIAPESTVLDIGAGNGLLADVIAGFNKKIAVDGIEPDPSGATIARPKYRNFYHGYADALLKEIGDGGYDYLVLADVIEHVVNPELFLSSLLAAAGDDVTIIASVPNCAFGSVRLSLLDGQFPYSNSGLLEQTHLRFFTIDTIRLLASNLGIFMQRVIKLERNLLKTELRPRLHLRDLFTFLRICSDPAASVYQYIIVFSRHSTSTVMEKRGKRIRHPLISFLSRWIRQAIRGKPRAS
jgi:2-polyprenyl-3-methyl-5-hydroxy-6-metoxy-1,4-benzoquinol methylase